MAPTLPAGRRRRRQLPSLFTLPVIFSASSQPKRASVGFFPVPSQRHPLDHPKDPLSPCWWWLSRVRAEHLQLPGACSGQQSPFLPVLPRRASCSMLFHPSSLCLAAPLLACWSRAALTRLLGGPGEHTRVHTRTLGALCRRRGGPKVSPQALRHSSAIRWELLISPGVNAAHSWGWRGGSVRYVRFLLLPASALAVWPRLSWCERAKCGVCVGSAALVLPSLPPVYSSASPGDFLPLCPHTLPLPALHEEMSGKCLKSSSEPSAFSTGRHRARSPGDGAWL